MRFLFYCRLYRGLRPFTMVPFESFLANLYLADRALRTPALEQGAIVECGTWKGGMAAAFAILGGPGRAYYFFDSFAGLPAAGEEDGEEARRWQSETLSPTYFDKCRASHDEFMAVIAKARLPAHRLHVYAGDFAETFPGLVVPPVAILRLDADWYRSTLLCLERFWESLLPGALVLIDDYYAWEGCRKAVHAFLARQSAPEAIRQSRFGKVAYIRKC